MQEKLEKQFCIIVPLSVACRSDENLPHFFMVAVVGPMVTRKEVHWLQCTLWKKFCPILKVFLIFCSYYVQLYTHHLTQKIICGQNVGTKVVCGMLLFIEKEAMLKIWKKSWVPFRSYLLNSTANPAHLHSNWAGLAVLFSR